FSHLPNGASQDNVASFHRALQVRRPPKTIVLDMDSSESLTYGEQARQRAYNGHFSCTLRNQFGDVARRILRQPGDLQGCHADAGDVQVDGAVTSLREKLIKIGAGRKPRAL